MTYSVGQPVRISARVHAGHHRTPAYVKGARGTVERVHDRFADPETRAYGGDGTPHRQLYLVGIDLRSVTPRDHGSRDRVFVDVFEHWLEPIE